MKDFVGPLTINRGRVTVIVGRSTLSIGTDYSGLRSNNVVMNATDISDAIDALVAMRELIDPRQPTKPEDAWREVAADMIRDGRDPEAWKVLNEHGYAPTYIKALEVFFECFQNTGPGSRLTLTKSGVDAENAWLAARHFKLCPDCLGNKGHGSIVDGWTTCTTCDGGGYT